MRSVFIYAYLFVAASGSTVTHWRSESKVFLRHGGHTKQTEEAISYHQEGADSHMDMTQKTTVDGKVVAQEKEHCDGADCSKKYASEAILDDA